MTATAWSAGTRPKPAADSLVRVRGYDWILIAAVTVLCVIGAFSAYAATVHGAGGAAAGSHYLTRSALNIVIGCIVGALVVSVELRALRSYAPVVYGVTVFALLAVMTPLGSVVNGARAWFDIGPLQLEPSEFAKLAVIVALATILCEHRETGDTGRSAVGWALAAAAVPMLLILVEPALGVAIIVFLVALVVLAMAGVPARWVAGLIAIAIIGVVIVFQAHLLKPYQEQRFTVFTNSQATANNSTRYQINQSEIAIGGGGLTGQGLLDGSQTNGGYVPEQQTDFVFTVVAEEGGFVGATGLLLALGVVLLRGARAAYRATDLFAAVIAAGVTTWFALQAFINIGMTLGIMPVTGVPLPFVSYGGSSMIADLIGVALLLSVGRNTTRKPEPT